MPPKKSGGKPSQGQSDSPPKSPDKPVAQRMFPGLISGHPAGAGGLVQGHRASRAPLPQLPPLESHPTEQQGGPSVLPDTPLAIDIVEDAPGSPIVILPPLGPSGLARKGSSRSSSSHGSGSASVPVSPEGAGGGRSPSLNRLRKQTSFPRSLQASPTSPGPGGALFKTKRSPVLGPLGSPSFVESLSRAVPPSLRGVPESAPDGAALSHERMAQLLFGAPAAPLPPGPKRSLEFSNDTDMELTLRLQPSGHDDDATRTVVARAHGHPQVLAQDGLRELTVLVGESITLTAARTPFAQNYQLLQPSGVLERELSLPVLEDSFEGVGCRTRVLRVPVQ